MAAPTVHLLSGATYGSTPTAIADAISATIDESGSPQEYVTADSPDVALVAVDRIAATVSVVALRYAAAPAVGAVAGPLVLSLKARAEGKGVTGSATTITYAKAVVISRSAGPVIEGSPSYTITFRCHADPA